MIKLLKAAIATTLTPVAIIADIATLPSSAYNNKHPFQKTKEMINIVNDNVKKTIM
jgi:hypothetical protein